MQGDIQDKLRAVIAFSLELEILSFGAAEAAHRMHTRAKAIDRRAESLRAYALTHMQGCGIAEISTDEWAAKIAKKPPSVNVLDAALIPAAYMRTPEPPPPAPDKAAIGAALKAGDSVPGCALVQGFRLALR